jgi:hypothetical protein
MEMGAVLADESSFESELVLKGSSELDVRISRIGNRLIIPRIIEKWLVFGHVHVMSEGKKYVKKE